MNVQFDGAAYALEAGESVLECLLRHGVTVSSFCRSGVCQSCVMRTPQAVPAIAQAGLKSSWRQQGYFLSCIYRPDADMVVEACDAARNFSTAVVQVESLSARVLRVKIARPAEFDVQAGQFIQLVRPIDGLARPYSVASLPTEATLELHVAMLAGGQMSQWLASSEGSPVQVRGPFGECVYVVDEPMRPLVLAGTGTGLSPLLGVVRAAAAAKHQGPIHLIHGAPEASSLYAWAELMALAASMPNLRVTGSVLWEGHFAEPTTSRCRIEQTPLDEVLLREGDRIKDSRIYLAGKPELVHRLRKTSFLRGAPLQRIHADPFVAPAEA